MSSLVSVIIATYNSSPFVLETLESISRQTWSDIELIITDDCSTDDTVEVIRTWLILNRKRFIHSEILTSKNNTGVSANANRGLHLARGEWVKFLGADDTLKPNCIRDNMSWIDSHPETKVLFSRIEIYRDTFEPNNLLETSPGYFNSTEGILAQKRSAISQHRMLLLCDRIHFSPSVFLLRETLIAVGGMDERFTLLEDYPLWLNLTKNGHKLYFMDKVTVNYRRHSKAINNTGNNFLINPNYFRHEPFRKIYTYPYLPEEIRLNQRFIWYASQIFRIKFFNKRNKSNKFIFSLLTTYLNPFRYYIWIRKRFNEGKGNDEFYM